MESGGDQISIEEESKCPPDESEFFSDILAQSESSESFFEGQLNYFKKNEGNDLAKQRGKDLLDALFLSPLNPVEEGSMESKMSRSVSSWWHDSVKKIDESLKQAPVHPKLKKVIKESYDKIGAKICLLKEASQK